MSNDSSQTLAYSVAGFWGTGPRADEAVRAMLAQDLVDAHREQQRQQAAQALAARIRDALLSGATTPQAVQALLSPPPPASRRQRIASALRALLAAIRPPSSP